MRRRPDQLPRGRHGLSREYVDQVQHQRILAATAEAVALAGYEAASIEIVREIAGVSRRTFYDRYRSKEDVFAAFYDSTTSRLLDTVDHAGRGRQVLPLTRVGLAVSAALRLAAADIAMAEAWLTPMGFVSDRVSHQRATAMTRLTRRLSASVAAAGHSQPKAVGLAISVGGVCEIVRRQLARGQHDALASLAPDLTYALLVGQVGHAAATKTRRRLTGSS